MLRVDHALEVHTIIGGEEREGEEDDGDAGEEEDSFVLRVGRNGEFILLNRAELKELEGNWWLIKLKLKWGWKG